MGSRKREMETLDELVQTLLQDETKNSAGIETIKKVIKNILQNPHEEKFRRLKISGKVFSEKLLPTDGAIPLLYDLGFQESGSYSLFYFQTISDRWRLGSIHIFQPSVQMKTY